MAIAVFALERFPIGRLSASSGVNIETIRYYERIKLLAPPPRTPGGRRLYCEDDVHALDFIRRSRELGFSLEETRALMRLVTHGASCRQVRDIALPRLEDIRQKLRDLRKMERALKTAVSRCSGRDVPECAILDALDAGRVQARAYD